jgi:DNA-binding NtrC family response regulator
MVKPTILVVDDEDDLRDLVRDVLESRGFTVLDAASGDAALKILEGDFLRIDLLFTDVRMPGNLNGFALAERAKAIRPDLAIVVTSGFAQPEVTKAITSIFPLLRKPFSVSDLLIIVADAVNKADGEKPPGQPGDGASEPARTSEARSHCDG